MRRLGLFHRDRHQIRLLNVAKDSIQLLERLALGLGHQEEGPNTSEEAHDGEEDVGAVLDRLQHGRDGHRNDKVGQPDDGRGEGHAFGTARGREGFRGEGPAQGAVRDTVDHDKNKGHGGTSPPGIRVRCPVLFVQGRQYGDDHVASEATKGTKHGQGTTADAVNDDEAHQHSDELQAVEDTRQDRSHFCVLADGLEEGRGIVDESVDAAELLEESHTHTDDSAAPHLAGEQVTPLEGFQLEAGGTGVVAGFDGALVLLLGDDALKLSLYAGVRGGQVAKLAQAGQALIVAVDHGEPAGRVGEEVDTGSEQGGADHLQAKGQAERDLAGHVLGAKGDPEGDDDAGDDGDGFKDEESSSEVGWCDFGDIERSRL